jgi:hypothetical protein
MAGAGLIGSILVGNTVYTGLVTGSIFTGFISGG